LAVLRFEQQAKEDAAEGPAIEFIFPAHYKLSVADGTSAPFHRFEVCVDQDDVGHLQSRPANDPKHPGPKVTMVIRALHSIVLLTPQINCRATKSPISHQR
jgi:hypothetical protein